jgi:predicted outer membrane repeat protein
MHFGSLLPLQCCALVQGDNVVGGGGAINVGGTMTLSDCSFNGNTAVRDQ